MILRLEQSNGIKIGAEGIKVGLKTSNYKKLKYLLSQGLYSRKEESVIRELSSNIIDSYLDSGRSIMDYPGYIILTENSISFRDNGVGMSEEFIANTYSNFLDSTKEEDERAIGCLGIGSKSPWSVTSQFTLVSIFNGVKRTYLLNRDSFEDEIIPLSAENTDEINGTAVIVPIEDPKKWYDTIVQTIPYFKGIIFDCQVDTSERYYNNWNKSKQFNEIPIIEGKTFYYRKETEGAFNICLDQVIYRLNSTYVGLPYNFNFPFGLKFTPSEGLIPTPSRESLQLTESSKNLIRTRLKECIEELHQYYEETARTLPEYFKNSNYITFNIGNEKVQVSSDLNEVAGQLGAKSFIRFNPVFGDIANLTNKENFFKKCIKVTGEIRKTKISPKRYYYRADNRTVLVDSITSAQSRFLRENYECWHTARVVKQSLWGDDGFYYCLGLRTVPREKWRTIIEEWIKEQKTWISTIQVFPDDEYQEWLKSQTRVVGKRTKVEKEEIKINYLVDKQRGIGSKQEPRIVRSEDIPKGTVFVLFDSTDNLKIKWFSLIERVTPIIIDEKNLEKLKNVSNIQVYTIGELEKSKFFQRLVFRNWYDEQRENLKNNLDGCYISHNGILREHIREINSINLRGTHRFLKYYPVPNKYCHFETYFETIETKVKKIYLDVPDYWARQKTLKSYIVSKIKVSRLEIQNQRLNEELQRCKQLLK